jgi:hypothetical protein
METVNIEGDYVLGIRLKIFWKRSLIGFGSYSQEISKNVFNKHVKNNSSSIECLDYNVKFSKINDSYFIFIEK